MTEPLLLIAIAEFDIDTGNSLSCLYPPDIDLAGIGGEAHPLSAGQIADHCLPDGGHLRNFDIVRFSLPLCAVPGLFGVAVFSSLRVASVRRGAVQKSIVLCGRVKFLDVFVPVLKLCLDRIMANAAEPGNTIGSLKLCFDALSHALRDHSPQLVVPVIPPIRFPLPSQPLQNEWQDVSLKSLLLVFGHAAMKIRRYLLNNAKVVVVGSSAQETGNCVLGCLLLIRPLEPSVMPVTGYTCLSEFARTKFAKGFLVGSTNSLFEERLDWADVVISLKHSRLLVAQSAGPHAPPPKRVSISKAEKVFIQALLRGLEEENKTETWVRQHFETFNQVDLLGVHQPADRAAKTGASPASADVQHVQQAIRQIWSALEAKPDSLPDAEAKRLLFELQLLCKVGSDEVPASLLHFYCWRHPSPQVRKYAISCLGDYGALKCVRELVGALRDPMPNVANAAASVLCRLALSFHGAHQLASDPDCLDFLLCALLDDNSDMEYRAKSASLLDAIFAAVPGLSVPNFMTLSRVKDCATRLRSCGRSRLLDAILLLLDRWGQNLDGSIPVEDLYERVHEFSFPDLDVMTSAAGAMLSFLLADHPIRTIQSVQCGIVDHLVLNMSVRHGDSQLARTSLQILGLVADTNYGAAKLRSQAVPEMIVRQLAVSGGGPRAHRAGHITDEAVGGSAASPATSGGCGQPAVCSPKYILHMVSCLGLFCENSGLCDDVVAAGGIEQILQLLQACAPLKHLAAISLAALHCVCSLAEWCSDGSVRRDSLRCLHAVARLVDRVASGEAPAASLGFDDEFVFGGFGGSLSNAAASTAGMAGRATLPPPGRLDAVRSRQHDERFGRFRRELAAALETLEGLLSCRPV